MTATIAHLGQSTARRSDASRSERVRTREAERRNARALKHTPPPFDIDALRAELISGAVAR